MANLVKYRLIEDRPRTGLARMVDSVRGIFLGPYSTKDKELARLFGNGGPASSGIPVNEATALTYSAVSCAVNLVSDDVSSLPLMLYKRLPNGGKDRYADHPLYELLHDMPNPEMGSMVFRRTMQAHVMIWRNAYAEIERSNGDGRPLALWPLVPERVSVMRDRGVLFYRVNNPSGGSVDIPARNMLHLVGQSHDGSVGSSFVDQARESLGLGLAAERFGATFFGNGATFGGVISYKGPRPTELSDKNYRETLEARHQGVERAHKLLALYNDATYTRMGVEPNNAQFLETRVFQVREVARWFKIPPHKLADLADATFSNVEQQNIDYYTSCLRPWTTLWEQELSRKLISRLERRSQFIEHVVQDLLRADAAGRAALYTSQFNVGALTPNDVRGFENQDPLDGGDRAFVPLNMIPLNRVDEWVDAQIEAKKPPPKAEPVPPTLEQTNAFIAALEVRLADRDAAIVAAVEAKSAAEARAETFQREGEGLRAEIQAGRDREAALVADLAARDEERIQLNTALTELKTSALRDVERLTADLSIVTSERDGARAECVAEQTRHGETRQALETLTVERDQLQQTMQERDETIVSVGEATKVVEIERETARSERDQARAEWVIEQTQHGETRDALSAMTAERDGLLTEKAAFDATRQMYESESTTRVEKAETIATELREQVKDLAALRAELSATYVQKDAAVEARVVLVAEAQEKDTQILELQNRIQDMTTAVRDVLVDKVQGILQREIDRARKAQATPEKLAKWIESFYPLHEEFCRINLLPAVRAWLACAGLAPDDARLDRWIARHLDESQQQLRLVTQEPDPDAYAAALERVLRRWETERADRTVDRWVKEQAA